MTPVYGKDISRVFYPEDSGGQPVKLHTQTPTIRLWDSEPSDDDAISGTGALSTVTTWTQSPVSPYACTYTIPAVADPLPGVMIPTCGYWETIICKMQTGGTDIIIKRYFEIARVRGSSGRPGATIDDLKAIYPAISSYGTDPQLEKAIETAEIEMRIELEGNGVDWASVADFSKTKLALAYKTLANFTLAQISQPGDKHQIRNEAFNSMYRSLMKSISLKFDANGDGVTDSDQKAKTPYCVVLR